MIKGSRWFKERPWGVIGEKRKTEAEEGKECPSAVNGSLDSRDDFQEQVCFSNFYLKDRNSRNRRFPSPQRVWDPKE